MVNKKRRRKRKLKRRRDKKSLTPTIKTRIVRHRQTAMGKRGIEEKLRGCKKSLVLTQSRQD